MVAVGARDAGISRAGCRLSPEIQAGGRPCGRRGASRGQHRRSEAAQALADQPHAVHRLWMMTVAEPPSRRRCRKMVAGGVDEVRRAAWCGGWNRAAGPRPTCPTGHAPACGQLQGQAALRLHVHLISDSTGETVTTVARAAVSQFEDVVPVEHVWFFVRTRQQLEKVLAIVEVLPGLVIFTLASPELRHLLQERCRAAHRALRAGARQRHECAGRPAGLRRPAPDRAAACAGRGLFPAHRGDRLRDAPR